MAGAAGLAGVGAAVAASGSSKPRRVSAPARPRRPEPAVAVKDVRLPSGVVVPQAAWLVAENNRPGTVEWVVTGVQTPGAIEGYASQVSAVPGDDLELFVNTQAPAFHVEAYRMGYYQGLAARLVSTSDTVAGRAQAPPSFTPGINMIQCQWEPSMTLKIDKGWPPGDYLLKLVGEAAAGTTPPQQYIPLCVRDDSSTAAYVIQNSVTTWQAYNMWNDYDLYQGTTPGGGSDFDNRSRVVSFDRPYPQDWAQGAADFFGNEFPILFQMESYGLDMTYWTDVDLHARPQLLAKHRFLLSLGHDEYWSTAMRNGAEDALQHGTNLAFLGANACFRHIRMQSSPVGPNRQQICYKDTTDPLYGVDNSEVTVDWPDAPLNDPESTLIGSMYQSIAANANMVISDPSHWIFDGCGFTENQQLPFVVQGEYDRYVPGYPGPTNVDVLAHSPITNQGSSDWSDVTYYTVKGGGGVFASGVSAFINKMSNTTRFPWNIVPKAIPGVTEPLLRAMDNLYGVFGQGPASKTRASSSTWSEVYQGSSGSAPIPQPTTSA